MDLSCFQEVVVTLENDSMFYSRYNDLKLEPPARARECIKAHAIRLGVDDVLHDDVVHREYVRRYFDARYEIDVNDRFLADADDYREVKAPLELAQEYPETGASYWAKRTGSSKPATSTQSQSTQPQSIKDNIMTNANTFFATKFLLNGADLSTLSNDTIYKAIAAKSSQIKALEAIDPKPARLVKEISDAKAELQGFIAFLDAKDSPATVTVLAD